MSDNICVIHAQEHYDFQNTLKGRIAMCNGREAHLLHSGEGGIYPRGSREDYCAVNHIDFFTLIHKHCEDVNFPPNKLNLWWGNTNGAELYEQWCERNNPIKKFKSVNYHPLWLGMLMDNTDDHSDNYEKGKINLKEKYFTFLSGVPKHHRIKTINFLCENNLLDLIEWSWVSRYEVDPLNKNLDPRLINLIPKSFEGHTNIKDRPTKHNPGPAFFEIYYNTYFDLVTETYYEHEYEHIEKFNWWEPVFFSEKIWRSIYNKRPFMIIGQKNSIKELQKLGFKTFPHIFDESYDSMEDDKRIYHVLNQLTSFTCEKLHNKIYTQETELILEHNYDLAKEIIEQSAENYPANKNRDNYIHIR